MSDQKKADEGIQDEMPTLEADKPKSRTPALVVAGMLAIAVVVVAGSILMKSDSSSTIRREAEEFALRTAKTPTPPPPDRPATNRFPQQPTPVAAEPKADPETERRIQDMAARLAEADAQARREDQARQQEAAKKAAEDAQKRLQARRHSGLTFASAQADQPDTKAPPPSAASANPFDRLMAQREALLAAQQGPGGVSGAGAAPGGTAASSAQPYGFLPSLKAARPDTVAAGYFGDPALRINQGKFIQGVLETAINSNLPGMVRAVVKHDVYAEDGSSVLVPAGSRLVGEYRSGVVRGQSRVAVIWHRISRPDGVDVIISSPGTDSLGVSGLTGQVDTHFWQRFGGTVLLSLIDVAAKRQTDQSLQVLAEDGGDAASVALENSINIPPTVHVDQGSTVAVFVAQDLDFSRVAVQSVASRR